LDIEYFLKLIANNGFPLILSIYLVWKLEFFITEIVKNQKEFSQSITAEIKEIKQAIQDLRVDVAKNRWNPYILRVSAFSLKTFKNINLKGCYKSNDKSYQPIKNRGLKQA